MAWLPFKVAQPWSGGESVASENDGLFRETVGRSFSLPFYRPGFSPNGLVKMHSATTSPTVNPKLGNQSGPSAWPKPQLPMLMQTNPTSPSIFYAAPGI